MKNVIFLIVLIVLLSSCIPERVKEKMDDQMAVAEKIFSDMYFRRALGEIELHKLRNGSYPNSLHDLQFLAPSDSAIFNTIEYRKLDSGYELNVKLDFPSFNSGEEHTIDLQYPPAFWKGLGCVKSNVKVDE